MNNLVTNGMVVLAIFAMMVVACRPSPPDVTMSNRGDAEQVVPEISDEVAARGTHATVGTVEPEAAHAHGAEDADHEAAPVTPPAKPQRIETTPGTGRDVAWLAPQHWPQIGQEDEFRVATWRLPAVSMAGAGECALFRFPGGGKPEDNLHRWMGQFVGADGEATSVEAAQAKRTINGVPATLVRAEGTYTAEIPGIKDSREKHENYALFGAVLMGEGDPVFAKCTAPIDVMAHEADAVLAWMDSIKINR